MAPRDFRKDQRSKASSRGPAAKGASAKGPKGPGGDRASFRPGKPGKPGNFAKSGQKPGHKAGHKHGQPKHHYTPKPQPAPAQPRPSRLEKPSRSENWLYGLHAVQAALANPNRKLGRALLTPRAQETLGSQLLSRVRVETLDPEAIGKFLPPGAVHQGAALDAGSLPSVDLEAILDRPSDGRRRIVLVLDQLSDPHNVGAILRSAAAFGVTAVVVQDRHAPPQSGALAKAASGALDVIPYVEVVNIARALDQLSERGFWRIALAGDGEQSLAEAVTDGDIAIVLGSEGDGIRRLVRERCEAAAFIPIEGAMESLNVSNAAAIALYELRRP
jgi:23S rRNA (guanosine2251-2'-O)-methyltransferase